MNVTSRVLVGAVLSVVVTGCSTLVTHKANLNAAPQGIRVYPPKVYLLVDTKENETCLLYTSPSPRDGLLSRMPSSA